MRKIYVTRKSLAGAKKSARKIWRRTLLAVALIVVLNLAFGYFIRFHNRAIRTTGLTAVVRIQAEDRLGTGFFVTDSYVLTAAHVAGRVGTSVILENEIIGRVEGKVIASGYEEWVNFVVDNTQVRSGATEFDWAVIQTAGGNSRVSPLFLGSTANDAVLGGTVFLAGHPQGQDLAITKGIISRIEAKEIATDSEVDFGFSGGPMIAAKEGEKPADGVVVGIIVSVPKNMNTVKTAVPIDIVVEKCRAAKIALQ